MHVFHFSEITATCWKWLLMCTFIVSACSRLFVACLPGEIGPLSISNIPLSNLRNVYLLFLFTNDDLQMQSLNMSQFCRILAMTSKTCWLMNHFSKPSSTFSVWIWFGCNDIVKTLIDSMMLLGGFWSISSISIGFLSIPVVLSSACSL